MNRIAILGTGYVGLVTGTCLSEFGMDVTCIDIDEKKIEKLKNGILPIYEPGLQALVEKNYASKRLKFTTDISDAIKSCEVIFIAVGTPPKEDGSADLQYVLSAAKSVANYITEYKVIINKSTVPVGTARKMRQTIKEVLDSRGVSIDFDIVSNPEFLREGAAIRDFMHPDRVIIGTDSEKAKGIMKSIYNVLYLIDTPFVFTNLETAELTKYASNTFLATKIGFINEIANLCDVVGADVNDIAKAMGMDGRIGKYFLHAGAGFGGSCFPKDTKALIRIGQEYGIDMSIVTSVDKANQYQKFHMVEKILHKMGNVKGKVFCLLGLAFKPETDDMREAPSITIINELIKQGATIRAYDPIAINNAIYTLSNIPTADFRNESQDRIGLESYICYCKDEYHASENADAIIILTEWNQFRNLDIARMKKSMTDKHFFDFRNIYNRTEVEQYGFTYEGVGR